MTVQARSKGFTEFSDWLRRQEIIASQCGFIATNIDYWWGNYKTGDFMFIEEKRHMKPVPDWQADVFKKIDLDCSGNKKYRGFHLIQFEQASPEDGNIYIDGAVTTIENLLKFLRFEEAPSMYESYFTYSF